MEPLKQLKVSKCDPGICLRFINHKNTSNYGTTILKCICSFFEASRLSLDQQMFQLVKFSEFDKEDFSTTLF